MRLPYRFLLLQKKEGDYSRLIRENKIAGITCRVAASSNNRLHYIRRQKPVSQRNSSDFTKTISFLKVLWKLWALIHEFIYQVQNYMFIPGYLIYSIR